MRRRITELLAPADPGRAGLVLLVLAALAIAVAGTYHGRLYHQGYAEVSVVGPLFVLNVLGSAAAVLLLLLLRRVRLFALAAAKGLRRPRPVVLRRRPISPRRPNASPAAPAASGSGVVFSSAKAAARVTPSPPLDLESSGPAWTSC